MNIIKLNAIDSTNTYLKQMAQKTILVDGLAVCADKQTSGRGQRGNSWYSVSGESLTMSVYKRFDALHVDHRFMINMAVSLAVKHTMDAFGIPEATIKWPNDIMSANKKLGGILIENVLQRQYVKHTIVGIGLNVNVETFPELPRAGSMKSQSGKTFGLDDVRDQLITACLKELQALSEKTLKEYKEKYENILFRYQCQAVFENQKKEQFEATIVGISNEGALELKTDNGAIKQVQIKELKMIY